MSPRRRPSPFVRLLSSTLLLVACAAAPRANPSDSAAVSSEEPDHTVAPDPLDKISHIPESNPYRAALTELLSLPDADRKAIEAWAGPSPDDAEGIPLLSADQLALARRLAQTVAQGSAANPTTAADWPPQVDPKDPENPIVALSPEIGPLRQLARITTRVADTYAPADAIPLYTATARLGREARQGETLIKQLVGVAIEGVAVADASRRLSEFSPAELEALSAAWAGLPPPSTIERAMETERALFFIPICEKILLPGAKAYFAAEKNPAGDDDDAPEPSLSHLRLSALVDFGDGEKRITLENLTTGEFFTVSPGRPAEGIELIEFDIPGQRAYIRVEGREAMINLQTKEVVARSAVLKKFRQFLDGMEFADDDDNEDGKPTRQAWLDRIKNHPGGPDAYFAKIAERYGEIIRKQIAAASQATPSKNPPPLEKIDPFADPLLESIAPTFLKVARTFNAADTNAVMLQAAIRHRLGQADRAPADPWAPATDDAPAAPFAYAATPDGGFTLTSRYERNDGEPTTFKFAAPDAGVIRKH